MKNLIDKYKNLAKKEKFWLTVLFLVILLLVLPTTVVLILAMFISYKFIDYRPRRNIAVFTLGFLAFITGIYWIAEKEIDTSSTTSSSTELNNKTERSITSTSSKTSSIERGVGNQEKNSVNTSNSNNDFTESNQYTQSELSYYKVTDVVDGDTVKLSIDGQIETIRLVGIDTPETVHPSKPVECFGREASNKAKELLLGKSVSLESDPSQGVQDKYGRLLGYIILSNGVNFNKLMIQQGFAYEYTYSTPYKYQNEFKSAEQYARTNKVGLWADGVCEQEEETTTQEEQPSESSNDGSKWYVSSHHTSKYYYCEESDDWKSLSESYLKVYNSESALLSDFPSHTLHESCQ